MNGDITTLVILLLMSYYDIKSLTIPVYTLLLFIVDAFIFYNLQFNLILGYAVIFMFMNYIINLNKKRIGEGDLIVLYFIAIMYGYASLVTLVRYAIIYACLFKIILSIKKKEFIRIPFLPFITIGFITILYKSNSL